MAQAVASRLSDSSVAPLMCSQTKEENLVARINALKAEIRALDAAPWCQIGRTYRLVAEKERELSKLWSLLREKTSSLSEAK